MAVEQLWRAGGVLYLSGRSTLLDVAEGDVTRVLEAPQVSWLALKVDTVNRHRYDTWLMRSGWRRHARFGEYDLFQRQTRR